MEYKLVSPQLQDIQTRTVRITAKAQELGAVTATTITIPLENLGSEDIVAADVLVARNLTDATAATASVVGTDLVLTDVAIAVTDLFDLVIRLK
jgi:hypothetical protein